jgi:hypothetical protein
VIETGADTVVVTGDNDIEVFVDIGVVGRGVVPSGVVALEVPKREEDDPRSVDVDAAAELGERLSAYEQSRLTVTQLTHRGLVSSHLMCLLLHS